MVSRVILTLIAGLCADSQAQEWTRFRGPNGSGISAATGIPVRWTDVNEGDDGNEDYRSRLVAKEIKRDASMEMFAATLPWEAKK